MLSLSLALMTCPNAGCPAPQWQSTLGNLTFVSAFQGSGETPARRLRLIYMHHVAEGSDGNLTFISAFQGSGVAAAHYWKCSTIVQLQRSSWQPRAKQGLRVWTFHTSFPDMLLYMIATCRHCKLKCVPILPQPPCLQAWRGCSTSSRWRRCAACSPVLWVSPLLLPWCRPSLLPCAVGMCSTSHTGVPSNRSSMPSSPLRLTHAVGMFSILRIVMSASPLRSHCAPLSPSRFRAVGMFSISRIVMSASRDAMLPPVLARVSRRTQTPVLALLVLGVIIGGRGTASTEQWLRLTWVLVGHEPQSPCLLSQPACPAAAAAATQPSLPPLPSPSIGCRSHHQPAG